MLVEAAMVRNVVTIEPGESLADAEGVMLRGRFRHLPVCDADRLVGMLSERDVRPPHGLTEEQRSIFSGRSIRSVMRSPVITVAPDDTLEDAARLLYENKISAVPVVRDGRVVGIITSSDVFHTYMRITGLVDPGTRVELGAENLPATLEAVAAVAREQHAAITTILTERHPQTGHRTVIVRFGTIRGPQVIAALRSRGLEVHTPEPVAEG